MKKGILLFAMAGAVILIYSCKKKNEAPANPSTPLNFASLSLNPSAINPGESSTITASATGDHVTYQWSTSHGDLFGAGSAVVYAAQPCCAGTNTVYCTVSDGKTSSSKSVTIEVYPGH